MQIRLDLPENYETTARAGACEHVDAREEISVALRLLREELHEPNRAVVELDRAEASGESIEVPIFVSEQALPVAVEVDRRSQVQVPVTQSDAISLGPDHLPDESLDAVPPRRTGAWLVAAALLVGFVGWGIASSQPQWLREAGIGAASSETSRSVEPSPAASAPATASATPTIELAADTPVAVGAPAPTTSRATPAAAVSKARTSKQRRSKRRKALAKQRAKSSPTPVAPSTSSRLPSTPTAVPYPS